MNKMREMFDRIADTAQKDKATLAEHLLYIVEEVGEVSAALIIESGLKNKPLEENMREECIDVIIATLGLLLTNPEWNYDRTIDRMSEKLKKWEARVND